VKVEFITFEGCPNHEPALTLLRETISELQIDADIEVIFVTNNDDAMSRKFLGSPSIRINGRDIESDEDESTQYSMRCRVYRRETGQTGVPPKKLIRDALRRAVHEFENKHNGDDRSGPEGAER